MNNIAKYPCIINNEDPEYHYYNKSLAQASSNYSGSNINEINPPFFKLPTSEQVPSGVPWPISITRNRNINMKGSSPEGSNKWNVWQVELVKETIMLTSICIFGKWSCG